jgi:hypothetical protein
MNQLPKERDQIRKFHPQNALFQALGTHGDLIAKGSNVSTILLLFGPILFQLRRRGKSLGVCGDAAMFTTNLMNDIPTTTDFASSNLEPSP